MLHGRSRIRFLLSILVLGLFAGPVRAAGPTDMTMAIEAYLTSIAEEWEKSTGSRERRWGRLAREIARSCRPFSGGGSPILLRPETEADGSLAIDSKTGIPTF